MWLTRLLAVATLAVLAPLALWATYSALFSGYPWLSLLPLIVWLGLWYVVRFEPLRVGRVS